MTLIANARRKKHITSLVAVLDTSKFSSKMRNKVVAGIMNQYSDGGWSSVSKYIVEMLLKEHSLDYATIQESFGTIYFNGDGSRYRKAEEIVNKYSTLHGKPVHKHTWRGGIGSDAPGVKQVFIESISAYEPNPLALELANKVKAGFKFPFDVYEYPELV